MPIPSEALEALLTDVQQNPTPYLTHKDPTVRSCADWTLEYHGLRRVRPTLIQPNSQDAEGSLRQLYRRLQLLERFKK